MDGRVYQGVGRKMIKAESSDVVRLEMSGTLKEIMADTCVIVNNVYHELKKQNETRAAIFKAFIRETVASGDMFSEFKDEESKDD